jgi:hypothetical protein
VVKEVEGSNDKSSMLLHPMQVQDESPNAVTTSISIASDFLSLSTASEEPTPYKLGIPTLRSATHRVRYSTKKGSYANTAGPKQDATRSKKNVSHAKDCNSDRQFIMPLQLQCEMKLTFDTKLHDLQGG